MNSAARPRSSAGALRRVLLASAVRRVMVAGAAEEPPAGHSENCSAGSAGKLPAGPAGELSAGHSESRHAAVTASAPASAGQITYATSVNYVSVSIMRVSGIVRHNSHGTRSGVPAARDLAGRVWRGVSGAGERRGATGLF